MLYQWRMAHRRVAKGPAGSVPHAVRSANFATALLTSISGSSWAAQRNDVMWFHAVASPGLAGEGSGEVSPVVNADLAEDGLGVVAHGVG